MYRADLIQHFVCRRAETLSGFALSALREGEVAFCTQRSTRCFKRVQSGCNPPPCRIAVQRLR